MLGLGGFGFGRKPRGFEYKPRHFDPEAEEREARRRAILAEDYKEGDPAYTPGMLIRDGQLRRMRTANRAQKQSKVMLIRVLIFLVLMGAIFILAADGISQMLSGR